MTRSAGGLKHDAFSTLGASGRNLVTVGLTVKLGVGGIVGWEMIPREMQHSFTMAIFRRTRDLAAQSHSVVRIQVFSCK